MGVEDVKSSSFDNFWRDRLKDYPETEEFKGLYDQLKGELQTPERQLPRPIVVSLIGIPGSGKSTFSKLLLEFIPAVHLRSDVIGLDLLPKGEGYDYYKAYVIQEALARHFLSRGYSVIMDDNNRTSYNRKQTYKLAQSYSAQNILFNLTLPLKLAVARTRQRDLEEGRDIHTEEETSKILLGFQAQIEQPEETELDRYQVIYHTIDTSQSLAQIRAELIRDRIVAGF